MLNKNIKRILAVAVLSSIAAFAFAEDAAPVYDVDNYPPQFDGQTDAGLTPDTPSASTNNPAPTSSPASQNVYSAPTQSMSLDQRIARVEQQLSYIQQKNLANKMDALQSDVQSLRGQVEGLSHQLQVAHKSQPNGKEGVKNEIQSLRAQVDQLSSKLQQLQSALPHNAKLASDNTDTMDEVDDGSHIPTGPATKSISKAKIKTPLAQEAASSLTKVKANNSTDSLDTATANQQPNVAEEQQIYQTAYDLIKAKKYNEAIGALQKMLRKYPSGQFAANAHYWLGELYGLLGKNDQSGVEFDHVVTDFPNSPKVADAQLKLGLIYAAQFKWVDAKGAFKKVINHYPGTASARLASEQLKQIKEAGH